MPPSSKRQKLVQDTHSSPPRHSAESSDDDQHFDDMSVGSGASGNEESEEEGSDNQDTDDEIAVGRQPKSKQTMKRKRRATDSTRFGSTLQALLGTDAPSSAPLSLKPSIARKHNDEKLEMKAKRLLRGEKKEKEEVGRVRDVIGGWGAEGERALRKVAQRGVVKLFNAIQQSQTSAATAARDKSSKGTGKPSLPAPSSEPVSRKTKGKDNLLGRGKQTTVSQDDFFDLLRSGGVVSKV